MTRDGDNMTMSRHRLENTRDYVIGVLIFASTIAYRLPARTEVIFDWDNAQFLLALENYNILAHQPHPTGYPLFVFIGWILFKILSDPQLGLTLATLAMYALGASCVFLSGRKLLGLSGRLGASLIYICSPLGGIFTTFPNSFAIEAGMSALMWMLLFRWINTGKENGGSLSHVQLAWAYGILGGFRMSFLIFSLPGILYVILTRKPKALPSVILHAAVAILIWLIPLIMLSGGIGNYLLASEAETIPFVKGFSPEIISHNLEMVKDTAFGMLGIFAIIPALFGIAAWIDILRKTDPENGRKRCLAVAVFLWIVPSILFFIKNHVHPGYLFIYLPLVAIGIAGFARWLSGRIFRTNVKIADIAGFILTFAVAVSLAINWTGRNGEFFSNASIRNSESRVLAFHDSVRNSFPLEKTVVVSWEHFRDVGWTIPETHAVYPQAVYSLDTGIPLERANLYYMHKHVLSPSAFHLVRGGPIEPVILPPDVEFVVVSSADFSYLADRDGFQAVETSEGETYYWKKFDPRIVIGINAQRWYIAEGE